MLERLAFQISTGPQAILVPALGMLACGALLLGFI